MESIGKGISKEDSLRYIEFCFCCPCCCNGLRNYKKWNEFPYLRKLSQSTGYRAKATENCTGCGSCVTACIMDALKVGEDDIITTDESCIGCGLCIRKCPEKALIMEEFEPTRDHILDYFDEDIRPTITKE